MSDDPHRPSSDRTATQRAVGYAGLASLLCLGFVLAAVGWFGADRPLTLAFIYVTAPVGAVYLLVLAGKELRAASRHRRQD